MKHEIKGIVTKEKAITQSIAVAAVEVVKTGSKIHGWSYGWNNSEVESEPSTEPNVSRPTLRQPAFECRAVDKYTELKNFRLEVNNVLITYNVSNTKKINYK